MYFIAGDVGSSERNNAIYYGEYDDKNKFIASGMGRNVDDNILFVTVNGNDQVEIDIIALNGENHDALGICEDYDQGTIE